MNAVLAARGYPTHPIPSFTAVRRGRGGEPRPPRAAAESAGTNDAIVGELVPLDARRVRAALEGKDQAVRRDSRASGRRLSARGLTHGRALQQAPSGHGRGGGALLSPAGQFDATLGARPGVPIKPDAGCCPGGEPAARHPAPRRSCTWATRTRTCTPPRRRECTRWVLLWGFRTAEELLASGAQADCRATPERFCRSWTSSGRLEG